MLVYWSCTADLSGVYTHSQPDKDDFNLDSSETNVSFTDDFTVARTDSSYFSLSRQNVWSVVIRAADNNYFQQ